MLYHHTKTINITSITAQLDDAIIEAEKLIWQAAYDHLQAFKTQMREKLGVDAIVLREPHLENQLTWFALYTIRRIEKLREHYIPEKKSDDIPNEEVAEAINRETNHITDRLKQQLDKTRQ